MVAAGGERSGGKPGEQKNDARRLASGLASGGGGRVGKRLLLHDACLLLRERGAGGPDGVLEERLLMRDAWLFVVKRGGG